MQRIASKFDTSAKCPKNISISKNVLDFPCPAMGYREGRKWQLMPQENINYPDPTGTDAGLSIHWSKADAGGTAQVGVAIPTEALREYLEGMDPKTEDHTIYWYTPTLTREELNKLIRIARRARTAVYGADE